MEYPIHGESKQPGLITLCTVMLAVATIAVSLRCLSIYVQPSHRFGFDDFFAIATIPFIIAESALIFWWISLGLGLHAATLPVSQLRQGPKIIFAAAFLYDAAISFPKFSALFFYYRVFEKTKRWFYIALWVVGSMNAAWLIAAWFSTIFQCIPVEAAWMTIKGSHCFSQTQWFLGTAIPSMIIDACILIMPLPMLWGLKASKSRRALVTGIFICGYSVIVVSIGRLVTLAKAGPSLVEDLTWSTITYLEWVQCEGSISVMSVCLPNIFSLCRRIHRYGARNALRGESFDNPNKPLSHRSVDRQRRFHKMGGLVEGAGERASNEQLSQTLGDANRDLIIDEEELSVLEYSHSLSTRKDFLETGERAM